MKKSKIILLPTDFSKASINAIEFALKFAVQSEVKFILFHSFIPFESALSGSPEYHKKETLIVESKLKSKIDKLKFIMVEKHPEAFIETVIDRGVESRQIINYCNKFKVNLIVMGTTGASGLREKIVGSITSEVISKSDCPVLAIPTRFKRNEINKILVPTNFYLYDIDATKFLFQFFRPLEPSILFLHVTEKKNPSIFESQLFKVFEKSANVLLKRKTKKYLMRFGKDEEKSISRIARNEKIDLIIMVKTNNESFIEKLFHLSLSKKMAHHAKIPILFYPAKNLQ